MHSYFICSLRNRAKDFFFQVFGALCVWTRGTVLNPKNKRYFIKGKHMEIRLPSFRFIDKICLQSFLMFTIILKTQYSSKPLISFCSNVSQRNVINKWFILNILLQEKKTRLFNSFFIKNLVFQWLATDDFETIEI